MDDAYLLHRVAYELRDHLQDLDRRNIAGGQHLLSQILPRGVVAAINDKVKAIRESAG